MKRYLRAALMAMNHFDVYSSTQFEKLWLECGISRSAWYPLCLPQTPIQSKYAKAASEPILV